MDETHEMEAIPPYRFRRIDWGRDPWVPDAWSVDLAIVALALAFCLLLNSMS